MRASSRYLRALLMVICMAAEEEQKTLEEKLKEVMKEAMQPTFRGKTLTHTSVGGQSVTYQLPASNDLTQQDIAEAVQYLYDQYRVITCQTADQEPAPTDKEICELIYDSINSARRVGHNFRATIYR